MQQPHHPSSVAQCAGQETCVVSSAGLQYHSDYSTAVQDPYASQTVHHPTAADFPSSMYVNTVWGPEQAPSHPSQGHVYYDNYPGAAAMYGYPGHHILPQDGHAAYPGMQHQDMSESGKRKRRRVISYEQRKAANVRERKRMCHLNDAFDVLRKRVPTFAYEKKLSRIETLKLAVTYIQYMAELLDDIEDKTDKDSTMSSDTGDKAESSSACSRGLTERSDDYRVEDSKSPTAASSSSACSATD